MPARLTCPACTPSPGGPDLDIQTATAALTLPYHNGRTERVNKTKMIKR